MPIAISIINKAVDRIPDDLDSVIKDFVIKLLKRAAAQGRVGAGAGAVAFLGTTHNEVGRWAIATCHLSTQCYC